MRTRLVEANDPGDREIDEMAGRGWFAMVAMLADRLPGCFHDWAGARPPDDDGFGLRCRNCGATATIGAAESEGGFRPTIIAVEAKD